MLLGGQEEDGEAEEGREEHLEEEAARDGHAGSETGLRVKRACGTDSGLSVPSACQRKGERTRNERIEDGRRANGAEDLGGDEESDAKPSDGSDDAHAEGDGRIEEPARDFEAAGERCQPRDKSKRRWRKRERTRSRPKREAKGRKRRRCRGLDMRRRKGERRKGNARGRGEVSREGELGNTLYKRLRTHGSTCWQPQQGIRPVQCERYQ